MRLALPFDVLNDGDWIHLMLRLEIGIRQAHDGWILRQLLDDRRFHITSYVDKAFHEQEILTVESHILIPQITQLKHHDRSGDDEDNTDHQLQCDSHPA